MQTYINQLVEDLNEKAQTKIEAPNYKVLFPDHPAIDYDLDGVVAYLCSTPLSFSSTFDTQDEVFPPAEKLTNEQAQQLCDAILNLWQVNNLQVYLPDDVNIPVKNLYNQLITYWKEDGIKLMPNNGGNITLDFCTYYAESCPWGSENCTCEDNFRKMSEEMEEFKKEQENKPKDNSRKDNEREDNPKYDINDDEDLPF